MTERLGTVLRLMQNARNTYSTIEFTVRIRYRIDLAHRATERWMAKQPPGTVATLTPQGQTEPYVPPVAVRESSAQVWVASAARWRTEHRDEDGGQIQIRDGNRLWVTDSDGGFRLEEDPWLLYDTQPFEEIWDPALLIPDAWLEPVGEAEVAGRRGIRVRALRRPTPRPDGQDSILLGRGDEHELVVDSERGIVLRNTAYLDGEEMEVHEVQAVSFDQPLSDELFSPPEASDGHA